MGEPSDRHGEDAPGEDAPGEDVPGGDVGQARDDWFASALGEEWESDGDGIYRFVPQASPREPAPPHGSSSHAQP